MRSDERLEALAEEASLTIDVSQKGIVGDNIHHAAAHGAGERVAAVG